MCLTFFSPNLKLWDNTLKKEKTRGGGGSGGERELKKKKTNINREKKERKEVIECFCFYGKLVKQKERYIF